MKKLINSLNNNESITINKNNKIITITCRGNKFGLTAADAATNKVITSLVLEDADDVILEYSFEIMDEVVGTYGEDTPINNKPAAEETTTNKPAIQETPAADKSASTEILDMYTTCPGADDNHVDLADLRDKLTNYTREEQDAALNQLRADNKISLKVREGRFENTQREIDASITDEDEMLGYVGMK